MPGPIRNGNARALPPAIALAEDQMFGPDVECFLKDGVAPASDLRDVEHASFLLSRAPIPVFISCLPLGNMRGRHGSGEAPIMPRSRVRNMPRNRDRRWWRKTCAPGGCDSARPRAEPHVAAGQGVRTALDRGGSPRSRSGSGGGRGVLAIVQGTNRTKYFRGATTWRRERATPEFLLARLALAPGVLLFCGRDQRPTISSGALAGAPGSQ